jgi:alkaline phosphatase D
MRSLAVFLRGTLLVVGFVSLASCVSAPSRQAIEGQLLRIGFGSCLHQSLPQPIWSSVLKVQPDIFLFMGDNWYAPDGDFTGLINAANEFKTNPSVIRLRQKSMVFATWDDHDYGLNDAGSELPTKEAAQKIFSDIFPMEKCRSRDLRNGGVYRECLVDWHGVTIQFLLLDTRSFRSALTPDRREGAGKSWYLANSEASRTMLGNHQWQWLEVAMKKPVELRVVVSSIQVLPDEHPFEKWGNFPNEEQRLLGLLCSSSAFSTLIVSGDRHSSEISEWHCPSGPRLIELTSSSLNVPIEGKKRFMNRFRIGPEVIDENFGLLTVTAGAVGIQRVTGQILGRNGQILNEIIVEEKGGL